ncbi:glycoside hydrolase family 26 protein [Streptomyces tendae]|uniref:glycoside hydrolase family 26 protein n=1 Tax=Streptomyces tendae TaxID=1932 RepID=UPI003789EE4C
MNRDSTGRCAAALQRHSRNTRPLRSVTGIVAAALLLTLATACSGSTPGAQAALPDRPAPAAPQRDPGKAPLVPAHGALLGHYYGAGTMAETDARIGRTPAVHLTYHDWTADWAHSPATRADFTDGRIPLINWEPFGIDFDDIIGGELDTDIRRQADGAKALGKPFFLDFAAEMNEEEGWGGHDPEKYVAAYRHIHDIFVARGATNVVWAWCPNVTDSPDAPSVMAYYPGDRYVDWTGVDGYNWGSSDPDFTWQSFEELFADIYGRLARTGKPVIIGEMASDEVGGSKAAWIDGVVPALQTRFPLIKAIVWFDVDKERHWQINSSASALAAYARMAQDPYLNP